MDMWWTWWTMMTCKMNTDGGLWKLNTATILPGTHKARMRPLPIATSTFKIVAIYSIAGTANIPKRNCWQLFWNQNWGWDWWFSSCVSPCTLKVYWLPWRRQIRFSVQRWWVLGEVKYRQFCCFSTSQGRLYRMFTWALAWDMPCFLSCTWYPSCKQICKKLQPKQLQRMMPQRPWPLPLEGGSRQNVATLKPNVWCWTHAFIIVLYKCNAFILSSIGAILDVEKRACLRPLKIRCYWPSKLRYKDWYFNKSVWDCFVQIDGTLNRLGGMHCPKKQLWEEMTRNEFLNHAMCGPMPFLSQAFKEGTHKKGHATERNIRFCFEIKTGVEFGNIDWICQH